MSVGGRLTKQNWLIKEIRKKRRKAFRVTVTGMIIKWKYGNSQEIAEFFFHFNIESTILQKVATPKYNGFDF